MSECLVVLSILVCKTENGASISGRLFTIMQTAKANYLVVDKYLEYVLENIEKIEIDNLLPWSEKIPKELSIKQYINFISFNLLTSLHLL